MIDIDALAAKYYFTNIGTANDPIFRPMDVHHVNSSLFTEAARHFDKYKRYEYPIPLKPNERLKFMQKFRDKTLDYDIRAFWVREMDRIYNGMSAPGMLINGEIVQYHITGKFYFKLNYCRNYKLVNISEFEYERKESFPDLWDYQAIFSNGIDLARALQKNIFTRKTRQIGMSEDMADRMTYNMYTGYGRRMLLAAYDKKFLSDDDGSGTLDKMKFKISHINTHTMFWRNILANNNSGVSFGVKSTTSGTDLYTGTSAISFKDNPEAGVGKSLYELGVEEGGTFLNINNTLDVMEPAIATGIIKTGMIVMHGTAGMKGPAQKQFIELCENPRRRNGIVFADDFTPSDKKPKIRGYGFFYPRQMTLKPFIDKDGNSDITAALDYIDNTERVLWKETLSTKEYNNKVAQYPRYPEESYSVGGSNDILPTELISQQIRLLEEDPSYQGLGTPGMLRETERGSVIFISNEDLPISQRHEPIDESNLKDNDDDRTGCILQYYAPTKVNGSVPEGLYTIVYDPYGINKKGDQLETRDSLACIFVIQNANIYTTFKGSRCVADYLGRPGDVADADKIFYMLSVYYNTSANGLLADDFGGYSLYENNRGEVFTNFKKLNALNYLMKITKGSENQDDFKNSQEYGMPMTPELKIKGLGYFSTLLKTIVGTNNDGDPIYFVNTILNKGMLTRWRDWTGSLSVNLDSLSAMIIYAYARRFNDLRDLEETKLSGGEYEVDLKLQAQNDKYWNYGNNNTKAAPIGFNAIVARLRAQHGIA